MLKQRILTALVLIPLVLWLVLFADNRIFSYAMMAVIAIAAYEWAMLSGLKGIQQYIYAGVVLAGMLFFQQISIFSNLQAVLLVVSIIWISLTLALILRKTPLQPKQDISYKTLVGGLILLLVAWLSVSRIHAIDTHGPQLVLALMVMIWIADTFAYFTGRSIGKHKLSPHVSPGKTWEGVIGGLIGVAVYGYLLSYHPYFEQVNAFVLSLLSIVIAFVSVGGDLFESRIKRQRGVKDSGRILPGHGGIYDRIDSLIAAAPLYMLGTGWLVDGVVT